MMRRTNNLIYLGTKYLVYARAHEPGNKLLDNGFVPIRLNLWSKSIKYHIIIIVSENEAVAIYTEIRSALY